MNGPGDTQIVAPLPAKARNNGHRRWGLNSRQFVIAAASALLAGCVDIPGFNNEEELSKGTVGYVRGFIGGVVADEPHAVLIGRDTLAAGGSAADAAVAMYFMMSVTYPSAAGLGGGGLCLVRDAKTEKTETLDFLGQRSSGRRGSPVNVPGNPRGFFALHAKYGSLEWRELIRPAENAARFGIPASRAFIREVAAADRAFLNSPALREMFTTAGDGTVREGDVMRRERYSTMLASIRNRGGGVLYTGNFAHQFAQAAQDSGGALTYADLQAFRPVWRSTIEVIYDIKFSFLFPMPRTPAGTMAAKTMALALDDERFQKADDGARAHLLAEAIQRAVVDGGRGFATVTPDAPPAQKVDPRVRLSDAYIDGLAQSFLPDRVVRLAAPADIKAPQTPTGGQTSFSVIDRIGNAVVCFVSMNDRFGIKRTARGTGAFLAAPATSARNRDLSAALTILARRDQNIVYLAGSASGGAMAQAALVQAALRTVGGTPDDLETALNWKRLYRDPVAAVTVVEDKTPVSIVNALRRRGHQVQTVGSIGRVNLIYCDTGIPAKAPFCGMRADSRGFGLASAPGS